MNPELEALIQARDAMLEGADGPDAKQLADVYYSKVDAVLERYPGLSREKLRELIERAHLRWLNAQRKYPTLPPKA